MSQTIHTILDQFREAATSNRDLGDRFERLMLRYFELDPMYTERFDKVWMWSDFPQKGNVGDVGIDLVARERATGEFCAIQCKFYLPDHTLSKQDIDSFFTASGKEIFTSCMIVSTTDKWGKNAEDALRGQSKPVQRLRVQDLDDSPVDWSSFSLEVITGLGLRAKKSPRPHQEAAMTAVIKGLEEHDRGKLIMACGTGKTFTSLCLAQKLAPKGRVLFLVPSLALMSQSLREWTAESQVPLHCLAVCSDANIGKKHTKGDEDQADITTWDLMFPATTNSNQILRQNHDLTKLAEKDPSSEGITVVFSTYQSLAAVAEAQQKGLPEFDLIICDEAHRTTGVTLEGTDESSFVKVHDNKFIKGKKRIYMTATPRVYSDSTQVQAKEANATLASMDNEEQFGPELHRLGFGEAVSLGLLSDYKVLVLAVDQRYISAEFQKQMMTDDKELQIEDLAKLTGCWNGLQKRLIEADASEDGKPMRRAVAFARSIKDSKLFVDRLPRLIEAYREMNSDSEDLLICETDHVDGTMGALPRGEKLDWLKTDFAENTCRILSNARCLSEGVDVPALDAVMFLNPRKSIIDVVQSVGRVMRKAEGKQYGYIILPVGIPAGLEPEEALKDNERYRVVWQVLQALRSHDDRFNATINQIELNKTRPDNIQVIGVGGPEPGDDGGAPGGEKPPGGEGGQGRFVFQGLDEWKDAIYAKIVKVCGTRTYWESWAKEVAKIAEDHTDRIKAIVESGEERHKVAFAEFLSGLRQNLNPSITQDDAIEMLSQHLITRPVFDALFANYAFTQQNPVSVAMQKMIETLEDQSLEAETAKLDKFYASVRMKVQGIDNAEGRQKVVVELYDKFFRTAFPKVAERLGIVYTPVEVVDFILHSVEDVLRDEFDSSISDPGVHIIDPFTGTGTFIVRLIQSGLIKPEDLLRKYTTELHANEIVLLAYYVAAINIEEAFHGVSADGSQEQEYAPFDGIVLTDTFQLMEDQKTTDELTFPENNRRVLMQKSSPIRVVIGNPPYSAGQDSENSSNQNVRYPVIDRRVEETYVARTTATSRTRVYDSYIRALRWASDRIAEKGIVAFVTNGSFIDGNAMDGLRACLREEFTSLYVFNLRGNQRTSGETSRREGGKVFGSGSRAGIAISVLVRNPNRTAPGSLRYSDIGDYKTREEKLKILTAYVSISGLAAANAWQSVTPNSANDWVNFRDPAYDGFTVLGDKRDSTPLRFFKNYSLGPNTNRDSWTLNSSSAELERNMSRMIANYNDQVELVRHIKLTNPSTDPDSVLDNDGRKIKWTRELRQTVVLGKRAPDFGAEKIEVSLYRPFFKQRLYYDRQFVSQNYQIRKLFPGRGHKNVCILVSGLGGTESSALITDEIPNLNCQHSGCQCFPLYLYGAPQVSGEEQDLFGTETAKTHTADHLREIALTDEILDLFRDSYESTIEKEDIFYYVYGILHSPEYKRRFANDLKKMLPRIPLTKETADFWRFSKAGRELAEWHLNYETIDPYPVTENGLPLLMDEDKDFLVTKMTFGRKDKQVDKTTIIYNSKITLSNIPLEAYDYVVNGKPAIEWIMERYQVTVDKDSGIRNDPNDWSREHNQPRYILDLLKRIIRVSLETNKIVASLPVLNEITNS